MSLRVVVIKDGLRPAALKLASDMPRIADLIVRRVAFDVVAEVAELVPVDTGRYRAGWRASFSALEVADGESETVSVFSGPSQTGITVTNPVEYGPFIEYGTASRPPGNHLAVALQAAHQRIAQELLAEEVASTWQEVT